MDWRHSARAVCLSRLNGRTCVVRKERKVHARYLNHGLNSTCAFNSSVVMDWTDLASQFTKHKACNWAANIGSEVLSGLKSSAGPLSKTYPKSDFFIDYGINAIVYKIYFYRHLTSSLWYSKSIFIEC